jgi:hypothetical protein
MLFGGSNENEWAMTWYPESQQNRDLYLVDLVKLYYDTIRTTLLNEDV